MRRTHDFNHLSEWVRKFILEREEVPDVILMEELNFTPPSWKMWKPKLIEKLSLYNYTRTDKNTGMVIEYRITYNKKEKMWKVDYISN